MTLLEDKDKLATEDEIVGVADSEYGQLNDPEVAKSKGRPTVGKQKLDGRFKTIGEQVFSKQQITCSHCGSHDHNIQTCDNLHLDSSNFPKKSKSRKKSAGILFYLICCSLKMIIQMLVYTPIFPSVEGKK